MENELDNPMGRITLVSNVREGKTQMRNSEYLCRLLEENPKFKMMRLRGRVVINNILNIYDERIKRIKIKYTKVNETTWLVIFQILPNQVDEGYIEVGITVSPEEVKSNAYTIDLPQFPEIETIQVKLDIEPDWWHENDLKDISYVNEKKLKYNKTNKFTFVYVK